MPIDLNISCLFNRQIGEASTNTFENIGVLRKKFLDKKITDRIFTITEITDLINNQEVVKKLKGKGFSYCVRIENCSTNTQGIISKSLAKDIKSENFSQLKLCDNVILQLTDKFSPSFNYDKGNEKTPVYIVDGNENVVKYVLFKTYKRKESEKKLQTSKSFQDNYFKKSFVFLYATGKDDTTRWFYLDKSNGTMYLLSETPKS